MSIQLTEDIIYIINECHNGITKIKTSMQICEATHFTFVPTADDIKEHTNIQDYALYFLYKKDEVKVYTGQTTQINIRMNDHRINKDFDSCIVFTSRNWNGTRIINFLEQMFLEMLLENHITLINGNTPTKEEIPWEIKPFIHKAIEEIKLIFAKLNIQFFDKEIYTLKRNGLIAYAMRIKDRLLVLKGSQVAKHEVNSNKPYITNGRENIRRYLSDKGTYYELTVDISFSSFSTAAEIIVGGTANGKRLWKKVNN